MILLSGVAYWLGALEGEHGLIEAGSPVVADLKGFTSAIYFSLVTATSVGYGDIVPVGIARVIAVAEAISALLMFGAVVAKFVSLDRKSWSWRSTGTRSKNDSIAYRPTCTW
jgi:hypothetical protein